MNKSGLSKADLLWIVCHEIPYWIHETECWGQIIWENWASENKLWPQECSEGMELKTHHSKYLQRCSDYVVETCHGWNKSFELQYFFIHMEKCSGVRKIRIPKLHFWKLIEVPKNHSWLWDATKIAKPTLCNHKSHWQTTESMAYHCRWWNFNIWSTAIEKYEEISKSKSEKHQHKSNQNESKDRDDKSDISLKKSECCDDKSEIENINAIKCKVYLRDI